MSIVRGPTEATVGLNSASLSFRGAASGSFTAEEVTAELGWAPKRALEALERSVEQADAWFDPIDRRYWLPITWMDGA